MRSHLVEGIIIKRTNFREADRVITLFTRSSGKVAVLAKGIRRSSSRRLGSLELFNHVRAYLIDTHRELAIVTEVVVVNSFTPWRHHLGRVNVAYQLCEVIDKLTPDHQPHPELFDLLSEYLGQISYLGSDWQVRVDIWLMEILKTLGYWADNFTPPQNIYAFIEEISSRPIHSPKLLSRLKSAKTAPVS